MSNKPEKKVKMVCKHCGSEEVYKDASVGWDIEKQEWVLITVFDNADCENCGGETIIEEIEI